MTANITEGWMGECYHNCHISHDAAESVFDKRQK